jgi:5-methylthioadenosine/S-adenosylhomocysteine deaminase
MQKRFLLGLLLTFSFPIVAAEPISVDLIVRGDYVLPMDADGSVIEGGAVVVVGDIIAAVGPWQEIEKHYTATDIVPGAGRVLMPGLINGHTHTSMTLMRGMVDDLDLMTWLNDYVFPLENRFVNPEYVRIGTQLACWEMIQGGTTSFVDMYFYPEVIAGVVERCGLRAIIGAPHIDFPSPGFKGWDDSFSAAIEFVTNWKGKNSRITPAFAPHAPYTVSPEHIAETARAAVALNAPITMHLAEAPSEVDFVWERYEATPIEHVAAAGLFQAQVIGAHMVQLTPEDIEIVAQQRVGAVHNPTSNMKLGAGVAPVTAMIAAGVNVGLGTDGAASNNDLDMFEEIRLAALLHKLKAADPTAIPAGTALEMATAMGARAVGLGETTGQLLVGKQADMIQLDFSQTRHQPLYDIKSHLVYVLDSQDVRTSIVAGRILMRDRQVLSIDEKALRRDVQRMRQQISAALAEAGS